MISKPIQLRNFDVSIIYSWRCIIKQSSRITTPVVVVSGSLLRIRLTANYATFRDSDHAMNETLPYLPSKSAIICMSPKILSSRPTPMPCPNCNPNHMHFLRPRREEETMEITLAIRVCFNITRLIIDFNNLTYVNRQNTSY